MQKQNAVKTYMYEGDDHVELTLGRIKIIGQADNQFKLDGHTPYWINKSRIKEDNPMVMLALLRADGHTGDHAGTTLMLRWQNNSAKRLVGVFKVGTPLQFVVRVPLRLAVAQAGCPTWDAVEQ